MPKKEEIKITEHEFIYGGEVLFPNFKGIARQFNKEGDRNFCVLLNATQAEDLKNKGWPVKYLKPKDPNDNAPLQPYMQIKVSYKFTEPKVTLVINKDHKKKLTELHESTIDMLDSVNILFADIEINPYNWTLPNGTKGVSAYLTKMYVAIKLNPLEERYYDDADETGAEPSSAINNLFAQTDEVGLPFD